MLKPPVSIALEKAGIPHRVFTHPGKIKSLEQAALERGQRPAQVIRSILFRITDGEYLMILIAGNLQIDWLKLRHFLQISRIRLASNDELLEITGYSPGAVAPFGFSTPLRVLLDLSVIQEDVISIGSGYPGVAVILASADLRKALKEPEIVPLAKA